MKIVRNNFAENYTGGMLTSEYIEQAIYTLEQEWRPDKNHSGGMNSNSCVPNGIYELISFRRQSGIIVPQLVNPNLGVFRFETNLPPDGGRFLILMHPGNSVQDVVGCIASGTWKREPQFVNDSRDAQAHIMQAFNEGDTELVIESFDTKEMHVIGAE